MNDSELAKRYADAYEAGHLTARGACYDILRHIDERNVAEVLAMLPEELLEEVANYSERLSGGEPMVALRMGGFITRGHREDHEKSVSKENERERYGAEVVRRTRSTDG